MPNKCGNRFKLIAILMNYGCWKKKLIKDVKAEQKILVLEKMKTRKLLITKRFLLFLSNVQEAKKLKIAQID